MSELGVAAIRGFQGHALPLARDHVFATLKHMTGHGQPEAGTHGGPASISERVLREYFFPPFAAGVQRGHARFLMPSYNEIDGIPSHTSTWPLGKVLRGETGFQGVICSDYEGIEQRVTLHRLDSDRKGRPWRRCARGWTSTCPTDRPMRTCRRRSPQDS